MILTLKSMKLYVFKVNVEDHSPYHFLELDAMKTSQQARIFLNLVLLLDPGSAVLGREAGQCRGNCKGGN